MTEVNWRWVKLLGAVALAPFLLGVLVGALTTALGLAFALALTRSNFRYKRILRAITVLPIITPPFVIGLALILLFGLSGTVTTFVADLLGVSASRWILSWMRRRSLRSSSSGLLSISMRMRLAASSIRSMALSGNWRSAM